MSVLAVLHTRHLIYMRSDHGDHGYHHDIHDYYEDGRADLDRPEVITLKGHQYLYNQSSSSGNYKFIRNLSYRYDNDCKLVLVTGVKYISMSGFGLFYLRLPLSN